MVAGGEQIKQQASYERYQGSGGHRVLIEFGQPVIDDALEERAIGDGVTEREAVCLEEGPIQRIVIRVGSPPPHSLDGITAVEDRCTRHPPQSTAYFIEKQRHELLLRPEVVQQHRGLCAERVSERPQRHLRDSVLDRIVSRCLKQLTAVFMVDRPGHGVSSVPGCATTSYSSNVCYMNREGRGSTSDLGIGIVVPTREAFLQSSPVPSLIDFAVRAEELGFDSLWVGDSLTARPRAEPLTLLAAIATRTNRAAIGTAALTGALRPTALAAHSIATVDQLADGRLVIGLGAGFPMRDTELEFAAAGATYHRRIVELERNVATWKWLWGDPSQPPPSGTDETIAQALRAIPQPARPGGPPLWLAGSGPDALKRAGQMFDGWLPYPSTASEFEAARSVVQAAAAAAGRTTRFDCAVYVTVAVDDQTARASERLDRFSNAYYGFSGETLRLIQAVVAGTPDECAEQLCGYVAAGANHLVLRVGDLDGKDRIDTLSTVAELVRSTSRRRELASIQEGR